MVRDCDEVRVGVVGSATGARTSPATSTACPVASSRGCCDLDETLLAKARARATRRRGRPTTDLDELLADPNLDAVVIATSVPTHYALGMRALEAGKHCFIEKPMALTAADARAVAARAAGTRRDLMVGHLLVYHPGGRRA